MEGACNDRQILQWQMRSTIWFARRQRSGASISPPLRESGIKATRPEAKSTNALVFDITCKPARVLHRGRG